MVSSARPQRRSRTTSRTGARPWCTPSRRMVGADLRAHPLDQLRVEARPPAQRRRVHGRLPGGQPGQALLVHHGRDAEPPGRHDLALAAGHRAGARRPGLTGAVPYGRVSCPIPSLISVSQAAAGAAEVMLMRRDRAAGRVDVHPDAGELGDLLRDGHPGQQIAVPGPRPGRRGRARSRWKGCARWSRAIRPSSRWVSAVVSASGGWCQPAGGGPGCAHRARECDERGWAHAWRIAL